VKAVNAKDEDGGTALMAAACRGDIENLKLLLENGADLNVKKKDGSTALTLAVQYGEKGIASLLKRTMARHR